MKAAILPILFLIAAQTAVAWKLPEGTSMEIAAGRGVGPISLSTGRADLDELLPPEALRDTMVHMGEGEFLPGTEIMAGTDFHVSIAWVGEEMLEPARITVLGSLWSAPAGVRTGMSVAEVEERSGAFQLAGFGWDYGGSADMRGTPLDGLLLRFAPGEGEAPQNLGVTGDRYYASNHPGVVASSPVLESIAVLPGGK